MKPDKKIFYKLMNLESRKVDEYLVEFANQIKNKISKSKDNDEIFKNIELLEEFIYKVSKQALSIINTVIKNKKSNKVKTYKVQSVEYKGKNYEDLALKCIELLSKVRYLKAEKVFQVLVSLYLNNDGKIKSGSIEILGKLVKYDFYALKRIGYSMQRRILDIILKWSKTKKIRNIEIIKIITKEFLKPSFEGISMKDYKTVVFKSGALQPAGFLKKIRRDTINLLFSLYKQIEDIKIKINLLEILYEASCLPYTANYGKETVHMITDDIFYLVDIYQRIVLSKEGKIIADLPITQEIERQLVWFNKNYKDKLPNISILLNSIRRDEFYDLYRTLVGDTLRLDRIEKEEWGKAEEKINKKIDLEFKKISEKNIEEWNKKLNLIAKYKNVVDEWKLSRFKDFLQRIAREKFELSKIILDDTFKNNKPLKDFIGHFLFGFRQNNSLKMLDDYIEKMIKERNIDLVKDISDSFFYTTTDLKDVRKRDLDLLSQIIKKEKPFDFLKRAKKNELLNLNFSLIRVIIKLYMKNKKQNKKQIEGLIIKLIKEDKEKQYLSMYLEQLGFPTYRNEIDLSEWHKENIKFILDKLVELKDLSYNPQLLLLAIARNDFSMAVNVFFERIRKREKMIEKKNEWISSIEYDAIPYHFNDKLSGYINQKKESIKIIEDWTKEMSSKSSIYNIELAQLFQKIGGSTYNNVLSKIIKKGKDSDLKIAIRLMWGINFPDFDFCFEIVKTTDDQKIWRDIEALIFSTGVVHGEYGLSEAYKDKIRRIKIYKIKGNKKNRERVEKFKEKVIKNLQKAAKREEQRSDEEIELMKLEFRE